ncbi:transposase [Bifidobacterium mongoliense]|uniref:Transposase n=1 Tax=Bifidobacterium mongoliense TaxID=518643 RepID=A0A423UDE8_9BIFI|nr:transposase [Bifidobacterium mongoliense]
MGVLAGVSPRHTRWAADALKAVFAMESRDSALAKAGQVATMMEERRLKEAATCLREGIGETATYLLEDYPVEHRRRIRTNTMIRTIEPGDPASDPRGGRVPGWQIGADARHRTDPLRDVQRLVHPALPGHVPARRHHERSELNIVPMAGGIRSAQTIGHYPGRYLVGSRYDSFRLDGSHVLCLISMLTLDALCPGVTASARIGVPLPTSIWMTCPSSSPICEYT